MCKRTIAFALLLIGMAVEGQAQFLQVLGEGGYYYYPRFEAAYVDSISYSYDNGVTVHFWNGSEQTFGHTYGLIWYTSEGSILSTLRQDGNYTNFIRLIEDGAAYSCLSRMDGASDLTVFAANDEAWQRFFKENAKLPSSDPWHTATSYEALTPEQYEDLLFNSITPLQRIGDLGERQIMRIPTESTWTPSLPILTPAFCEKNEITEADQHIMFGNTLDAPWMPGVQITEQDAECANGYLERISVPLRSLGTMADVIRANGKTNIFAHIMEKGNNLAIDPGNANYYNSNGPEYDMAAMFVPSDEEMWRFFRDGMGQMLLRTSHSLRDETTGEVIPYTSPTSMEELLEQIDCIPANALDAIINSHMHASFVGSVPSKWDTLTDNALNPWFEEAEIAREQIDTCLFASNGIVYVLDRIDLPYDFTSVVAPAYVSNTCQIIKSAIYDDYMNWNFLAFLNEPQQDITFFLPTDEALSYYFDPVSMKSRTPRVILFSFVGGDFPVRLRFKNYHGIYNKDKGDPGTIGTFIPGASQYTNDEVTNRLKEILFSHTIINDDTQNILSRNEYYRTLGGDVVKVVRDADGNIIGAKGSFQMENERLGISSDIPGILECKVADAYESLSNGQTYTLNAPLVPTWRSLWSLMTNDADMEGRIEGMGGETPCSEFYKLCAADAYEDVIIGCGLVDENLNNTMRKSALKKYKIFISDNGLDYNFSLLMANTPYTAYIPTNEAVRNAIAQGLPTWEDIREDYESHCQTLEDSMRIAGKITTLTNIVKAHFHFGMAIADQEPFQREYKSLWIDEQTLASPKVKVNCAAGGQMTVTDWKGKTVNVVGEEKNIFVHDYTCSSSPVNALMRGVTINSHRPCVVHQIDGVLGFK